MRWWPAAVRIYVTVIATLDADDRSDADPLQLRWIDPHEQVFDALPPEPTRPRIGGVYDGSWDQRTDTFSDRPIPRALRNRFESGCSWSQTEYAACVRDQYQRFGNAWGYRSAEAVPRRQAEVEALFESMSTKGYLTQAELATNGQTGPGPPPVPILGEIILDIGRDGQWLWQRNGQHRLALARVLDIDTVPIVVGRRHRVWQTVRTRARQEGIDAIDTKYRSHPDLNDLRDADSTGRPNT